MGESYGGRGEGASVMAALRIVSPHVRAAGPDAGALLASTLERDTRTEHLPARLEAAPLLETFASGRGVVPAAGDGFVAFLDGIQRTRVLQHLDGTIPVVHATVAAAIRERRDRVLRSWDGGTRVVRSVFLPVALAGRGVVDALEAGGIPVVDTAPGPEDAGHPLQLLAAARQSVQQLRESLEAELATSWGNAARGPLYVDGGIGGLPEAARHADVVGVVKSHRTLYGDSRVAQVVAALGAGERTSAFLVSTRRRAAVASWYLRLREGAGDPFGGLVRVEIAESSLTPERADRVSGWILREREPVALPDPRWRMMAYGIRDCEEYLRAVTA